MVWAAKKRRTLAITVFVNCIFNLKLNCRRWGILFESSNHLVSVLITFFSSQNRTVDCILQIWQNHEYAWWMNSWCQKISASLWFLPVSWTPCKAWDPRNTTSSINIPICYFHFFIFLFPTFHFPATKCQIVRQQGSASSFSAGNF